MRRELAMEFTRVTEAAALATHKKIGSGDKNGADDAAVKAMRYVLNQTNITAEILIGEGEMDEAPMLYCGEKLGAGGDLVDIAVDPIEGTKMVVNGQPNALATILGCEKGKMICAPDMYMEKFVFSEKNVIDLDATFEENVRAISKALNKPLNQLTMTVLNRERHKEAIDKAFELGVKVFLFEDGDVAESINVFLPESEIDFFYSIGGAPEGVLTAGVVRAFDGDMQARLIRYDSIWPNEEETARRVEEETRRCNEIGLNIGDKLTLDDLIWTDDIIFSATGITDGTLLKGVKIKGNIAETETLIVRAKTKTIRRISSTHFIDLKDDYLKGLIYDKE